MKRIALVLFITALGASVFAQDEASHLVSFNVAGPVIGLYQASYELGVTDYLGVQIAPFYLNGHLSPLLIPALERAGLELWSVGASLGAFYYFGLFDTAPLEGFFAGPRVAVSYFYLGDYSGNISGMLTTFEGLGGYRWIFGNFAIALGGEINYSLSSVSLNAKNASAVGTGIGFGVLVAFDIAF